MATKKNYAVNGSEYYRIRRTVGHVYDANGNKKPVQKSFYGTSKRDAEQKYLEWKESEHKKKERINLNRTPFGTLAKLYDDSVLSVSSKYSPGTIERYSSANRNWVQPDKQLCSIPICDLTAMDLQMYYNRVACTKSTIEQVHKFMRGLFKWLVMQNTCSDLLAAVEMPVKPEVHYSDEIVTWTDEEMQTIRTNLETYRGGEYRLRFFIILCSMTGLRISEELGLKYSDFKGNSLHIERQYYRGDFLPPKANSIREMPITPDLQRELERHRVWHKAEMLKRGYKTEYVFTTDTGKLDDYKSVVRSLKRYYTHIGVPNKKFHAYRATFCTNLCKAGVPIQVASKLLGHKSIEVTSQYYTDVDQTTKYDAVMRLENTSES